MRPEELPRFGEYLKPPSPPIPRPRAPSCPNKQSTPHKKERGLKLQSEVPTPRTSIIRRPRILAYTHPPHARIKTSVAHVRRRRYLSSSRTRSKPPHVVRAQSAACMMLNSINDRASDPVHAHVAWGPAFRCSPSPCFFSSPPPPSSPSCCPIAGSPWPPSIQPHPPSCRRSRLTLCWSLIERHISVASLHSFLSRCLALCCVVLHPPPPAATVCTFGAVSFLLSLDAPGLGRTTTRKSCRQPCQRSTHRPPKNPSAFYPRARQHNRGCGGFIKRRRRRPSPCRTKPKRSRRQLHAREPELEVARAKQGQGGGMAVPLGY
jgi:hypothetical protein